ncbi:hypothetical protein Pan189_34160 [Stratiformator vulcanicus]|uniref:Leucine Rich repeats (2 copies) n=2 Tax=Stratiformator vulcanicus TaxID=2527980 RepID=A0A517R550_9PLAN|nr:hypothetical protein Pan189_34160 [Stratiformator vulcanicus]
MTLNLFLVPAFLLAGVSSLQAADEASALQALKDLNPKKFEVENNDAGQVTSIRIDGCRDLTDEHLRHFAAFPELRELKISHATKFDGSGARYLTDLQHLESLQVGGTRFSNEGLQFLSSHPNLQALQLRHAGVTDDGMTYAAQMPNLKEILVSPKFTKKIADAGVRKLAQSKTLEDLTVEQTFLTYEGSLSAYKNHPSLKTVYLRDVLIGESDIEKLKADHPNANIRVKVLDDKTRPRYQKAIDKHWKN